VGVPPPILVPHTGYRPQGRRYACWSAEFSTGPSR
jgi:hypothetical protein